jgi:hypothetical protein
MAMRFQGYYLSCAIYQGTICLKDTIKTSQFKHKPGLILDPGQSESVRIAPENLVASQQGRQALTINEGHLLHIDHDALDTTLRQIPEDSNDVF